MDNLKKLMQLMNELNDCYSRQNNNQIHQLNKKMLNLVNKDLNKYSSIRNSKGKYFALLSVIKSDITNLITYNMKGIVSLKQLINDINYLSDAVILDSLIELKHNIALNRPKYRSGNNDLNYISICINYPVQSKYYNYFINALTSRGIDNINDLASNISNYNNKEQHYILSSDNKWTYYSEPLKNISKQDDLHIINYIIKDIQ